MNQQKPVEQKIEPKKQEQKVESRRPGFFGRIKNKISEYKRVVGIAKKPDRKEFKLSSKITGAGIIFIGLIGFIIFLLYFLLRNLFIGA
jgi:protein transport protein SEC61 subunit gamma-like protein